MEKMCKSSSQAPCNHSVLRPVAKYWITGWIGRGLWPDNSLHMAHHMVLQWVGSL